MSLARELDAIRTEGERLMPPETVATMHEAVQDLSRSGILDRSLKVGDRVPGFILPNAVGQDVRLYDLIENGPVVISFYRGEWCSFCTAELQAFQATLPAIRAVGATLVAISPQTPDHSLSTAEKQNLTFEVLSDVGNRIARQFGIVFHLADEMQALFTDLGLDLPEYTGDETFDLPVPATYVVDTEGIIRLAFVDPD